VGFLKKVLPWIGAAATGNVPALVTMAAKTVSDCVGGKVDSTVDAIAAAVSGATPDQLLALKQADNDFAAKMQAMGFEHEEDILKIEADDRANARTREISLRDKFVPVLAVILIGSFVVAVLAVIRGWGKVEAAFAGTLIGYLAANANQVVSYYFGSSAGSARKTEILGDKN
jgi:4-hydroxybenzoate polyprenyltransferase